jgi:endonuclease G
MTDRTRNDEIIRRLERLAAGGAIDRAIAAIGRGAPVLAELGLSGDRALALLRTPPGGLESAGMPASQLEAIVRLVGRPPLVVQGDEVLGKQTLGGDFPPGTDQRIRAVEPLLTGIGRIEFVNHDLAWGGTGWIVAGTGRTRHVLTNRHVAQFVARRTFRGDGVYLFSPGNVRYGARIDFGEEADQAADPARLFRIEAFSYLADDAAADVAIGRVTVADDAAFLPATLELSDADGEDGELVAVVGYPASDPFRNDPTAMERYFRGLYDVKRFSPGFLKAGGDDTVLGHDCTTLGGNSGSPVISLDRGGKVVGLHFAGAFGEGNSAVRAATLRGLLDGLAGDVHPGAVPPAATVPPPEPEARRDPAAFANRPGYDPDFLQVAPVPLPLVPGDYALAAPSDATPGRPQELRYRNFGILFSGALRMPAVAALNIDGGRMIPQKRGSDSWAADPRLPAGLQLDAAAYADSLIDRGHMVRRAATNWGDTTAEAQEADADTFHYAVACPQHLDMNRGSTQWLGLEDYILHNARTLGFRCTVLAGPVRSDDDPELGSTGVPLPMEFWKIVAMPAEVPGEDGIVRLHATAYVLSQGRMIREMMAARGRTEAVEGFAFGAWRTFQVRVRDVEARTGIDFGPLREADPLERAAHAEAAASGAIPIDRLEAIIL